MNTLFNLLKEEKVNFKQQHGLRLELQGSQSRRKFKLLWRLSSLNKIDTKLLFSTTIQISSDEYEQLLVQSTTLYVGNLSFYTTEEQIYELFSMAGDVRRVVMGLDRHRKTPCGFCFVEYYEKSAAQSAINYINGTKLDGRIVRTDWDIGFKEGRQYGRGRRGGQVGAF